MNGDAKMNDKYAATKQLLGSGIRRRDFVAGAAALAFAAGASSLPFSHGTAATPKPGGRFRFASAGSTQDVLDPALMKGGGQSIVSWGFRNNLVEIDAGFNAVPELAESLEPNADATQWVLNLRKEVEFHNGKTLDAEDVLYSLNHHRGENSKSSMRSLLKPIKEARADGKNRVIVTLESGNADFPYLLADYHLCIFQEGVRDFETDSGTGAYVLKEWQPGERAVAVRNPNYWKSGRGNFDEVEFLVINDQNARMTALKTGQADAIMGVSRKTADLFAASPDIQLVEAQGTTHMTLPMLTDVAPFDDVNVRLAVKHAVNREEMVEKLLAGHGAVGNDHPIAPANRYYAANIPQREYDPDKAKFYLQKAGLNALKVNFHTSDLILGIGVDVGVLYKEHAAPAGIEIEVVREPTDGYWERIPKKKPWIANYYSGRPTEDWMFTLVYAADAAWNETRWKHDRFNELLKEARGELDDNKRREMYQEMQLICRDEGGTVVPFFLTTLDAASTKIAMGQPAGNFDLDGYRAPERWWFA